MKRPRMALTLSSALLQPGMLPVGKGAEKRAIAERNSNLILFAGLVATIRFSTYLLHGWQLATTRN